MMMMMMMNTRRLSTKMAGWWLPLALLLIQSKTLMVQAKRVRDSSSFVEESDPYQVTLPNGNVENVVFRTSNRRRRVASSSSSSWLSFGEQLPESSSSTKEEDTDSFAFWRDLLWMDETSTSAEFKVKLPNGKNHMVQYMVTKCHTRRRERNLLRALVEDQQEEEAELVKDGELPYGDYKVILPNGKDQFVTYAPVPSVSSTATAPNTDRPTSWPGIQADIAAWASEIYDMQDQDGYWDNKMNGNERRNLWEGFSGTYRINGIDGKGKYIVLYRVQVME